MADTTTPAPAEAPPEAAAAAPAAKPKSMPFLLKLLLYVVLLGGVVFLQKAMVFAVLAMLPSFIALFLDHDPRKPAFFTITAFNFAGFFPYLMKILMSQSIAYGAEEIFTDFTVWVVIYGSAFIGWLIVAGTPALSLMLVQLYYAGKVARLEAEQKKFRDNWGVGKEKAEK